MKQILMRPCQTNSPAVRHCQANELVQNSDSSPVRQFNAMVHPSYILDILVFVEMSSCEKAGKDFLKDFFFF